MPESLILRRLANVNWARVFCAYGCFYIAMIIIGGEDIAKYLTNVGYLIFNLGFAGCLWYFGRCAQQYPWLARAFNACAVSFLLVGAGNAAVFLLAGSAPFFLAVDLPTWLYLASYVPLLLAVHWLSTGVLPEVTWHGRAHDRIVLAVGVGMLIWFLIAAPLLRLPQSPADRILSVVYPTAVLLNFLVLIPLVLKSMLPDTGSGAWRFAIGLAAYLASDLFYQVMPLLHGDFLGLAPFAWADIAYVLSYMLMVTGAHGLARDAGRLSGATPGQVESARAASALALFMMAAVYVVLWRAALTSNWNNLTIIAVCWGVITVLVIIHGVISVEENRRLIEERAQRSADEKMMAVIRDVHVGISLVGPDFKVRYSNPVTLELLGLDDTAPRDRSVLDPRWKVWREDGTPLAPDETPTAIAIRTGQPQRNVVMSMERRNDSKRIWVLTNAEPHLAPDGTVEQVTTTIVDITERIQLEAHLRDAQRMESIGQLSAGIAHDFNNLLTVISGSAELLRERSSETGEEREFIDDIMDASARAAVLTAQLLAFGRRQMLKPEVLEINDVLTRTEKMLRRVLGEHVQLRLDLAPQRLRILADRGQMEQVIVNLSINARDAMRDGGTLTIRTRTGVSDSGVEGVFISFQDTGHGMDEATRRRVFEPFFTTRPVGSGTGLGLSVVYGIIKQSLGEIEVESAPGAGTTFTIFMPLTQRAGAGLQPLDARQASATFSGTGTVMVIEDDDSVRGILRAVLERAGYRVIESADGAEAKRMIEDFDDTLDLLVTDVILPGCSGPELVLHGRRRWPDLPVLFMSGYADDRVGPLDPQDTRTRFLQKPFTHVALRVQLLELTGAARGREAPVA